ncbi:MAG: DUF362 domain-containing protein [Anaerolineae bacterium]|nr:DUF362 domain-containing protein [Anaerolineae bacterium]
MTRRHPLSRRTFIKLTATVAAGAALASCSPAKSTSLPTKVTPTEQIAPANPTSSLAATVTNPAEPTAGEATPAEPGSPSPEPSATSTPAYLAVAHGPDPAAITRAAIGALGGMASFVSPGYDVIIKPNICTDYHPPEYASTTNPTVVATLVSMCLEAGAKRVRVMDYPFGGTAKSAYEISGIKEAVEAAGGEMHVMTRSKYEVVDIHQGKDISSVEIYPDILNADLLINVPIAKNHGSTKLTLGGKNLMGVILDRNLMHINLSQRIAALTSLVMPELTVIDAVRILTRHGPTGGDLADVKQMDTIIASRDIVAADAYATTLFGMSGEDIGYIKASAKMGLGTLDLSSINIQELKL